MKIKNMKLAGLAVAALFCTIEANAQVGIGTPTPTTSAQLEVLATNKGVLIPRVALTSTAVFAPVVGTEAQSLLVFNTGTAGAGATAVTPGFYYWMPLPTAHWERIVNQEQLSAALTDLSKVTALLNTAYPQNNLGATPTVGSGGGMFYDPAVGTDGTLYYIQWNATTSTYDKIDINAQIADLIKANETVTTLLRAGTGAVGAEIEYTYTNESGMDSIITVTADVLASISSNVAIQDTITNLLKKGGNVYYNAGAAIPAAGVNEAIPQDNFYYFDDAGARKLISLTDLVVAAILGSTTNQVNTLKQKLGDTITTASSAYTGDTYVVGSTTYYIYKGEFPTTVTANTAQTTGIALDKPTVADGILSISVRYGLGSTASVTNLAIAGTAVGFNIGVGTMYNVLGTADIPAKVFVEFASTAVPPGL